MKYFQNICCLVLVGLLSTSCRNAPDPSDEDHVSLVHDEAQSKVDVFIDGAFFTSYLYAGPLLKKPVLYPLITSSEKTITRGYPLATREGERVDHPHHYGLWFNHGKVNGIDFWNSSVERWKSEGEYGIIRHKEFIKIKSGDTGVLTVSKEWFSDDEELILEEETTYLFRGEKGRRTITHTTTLHAPNQDVLFEDSKEGMFAMRVARELEHKSPKPVVLTGKDLEPLAEAVPSNENVTGHYLNSERIEGYPDVWGKRAKWVQLSGIIGGDPISVCIFDHTENINHPPHWMTRDYGLYGVNALGSNVYTEGKETLNHVIKKSESLTFKNVVVISDGAILGATEIDTLYQAFL